MTHSVQEDAYDRKILLNAVLKQAMDDYIKLQHPKFRKKKYMQEAFDSAVEMFFDSSFSFMHLKDENMDSISLKEMISQLMNDDRIDIDNIKEHVINEARAFWEVKLLRTLYIPDSFIFDGHVYSIYHTDDNEDSMIDFDQKTITVNKDVSNSENQQFFMKLCIQVISHHEEYIVPSATLDKLSNSIFKMLRMNSCFTGD
jgi:hypothetical protein